MERLRRRNKKLSTEYTRNLSENSNYTLNKSFQKDDNIQDKKNKKNEKKSLISLSIPSSSSSSNGNKIQIRKNKMASFIPTFRRSIPLIPKQRLHYIWILLILIIAIILYFVGIIAYYYLPKPLTRNDEITLKLNSNDEEQKLRFIAENAYKNLNDFVKIGPKVVGSPNNEQIAVKYLIDRILKIQNDTKYNEESKHSIEVDVQDATGNYIIFNVLNMYQGIQNVVVKLSPKNLTNDLAILVNSHFDSVPGSPGGGDDGTMVVVMIEVLRVLAKSNTPLKHSIVFLFNGAEENPLQGSHAFITQHKWAKNIRAFINLDSAGNGGKEILFQAGPQNSWIVKYYKDYAIHPFGQTIAEELFQKNLIPSDTDFRIFRDYGKIPGLDMAHSYNGYVYHTKFDDIHTITPGTLQNTGDNLLVLTAALANAEEIENPVLYNNGEHRIFYDLFGLYLITYSEQTGFILNLCVSIIAIIFILFISIPAMRINSISLHPIRNVYKHFIIIFFIQLISFKIGILLCILIAFILDLLNFTLIWFTHTWLIFGLYFCPLFFLWAVIPTEYLKNSKKKTLSLDNRIQLFLHSHCLVLAFLNIGLTWGLNVRSTYILTIAILCYLVPTMLNLIIQVQNKPHYWLIAHFLFQAFSFTYFSYLIHSLITAFIPMTGRGASLFNNPEYLICIIVIVFGMLLVGFLLPALNDFSKSRCIPYLFLLLSLVFFIIALTPVGFPYRAKTSPQRHVVFHTKRVFHNKDFSINRTDFGYFILPLDKRSLRPLQDNFNNITILPISKDNCEREINCGVPSYMMRMDPLKNTSFWSPTNDEPNLIKEPKLKLISKLRINMTLTRYRFELFGPDHMTILIAPAKNNKLIEWSFNKNITTSQNWMKPHFIHFSYGLNSTSLKFYLDFQHSNNYYDETIFGIAVVGHLNHHNSYQTEEFRKFLKLFPPWTYVLSWMASYHSWVF